MAKFYGTIGYVEPVEVEDGIFKNVPTERKTRGDVLNNSRTLRDGETVNGDLTVGNSISIVSDAYANEHFFAMKYIRWAGVLWSINKVDVRSPRLILRLGGVYNGPTVGPSSDPEGTPSGG